MCFKQPRRNYGETERKKKATKQTNKQKKSLVYSTAINEN